MRKTKRGKSINRRLEYQHFKFYVIVFLLGFFLLVVLQVIAVLNSDKLWTNIYSADILIEDDYRIIDVSSIRKNEGSAQIVTKDLQVITLTGDKIITEDKLSVSKWSKYLTEFGKTEVSASRYNSSVAYSEKGEFWLVITFPAPLEIQISVMAHPASKDFSEEIFRLILIAVVYVLVVLVAIYFFSKRSANHFIHPLRSLQIYTKELENGNYEERMNELLEGEFGELQETFYQLAKELKKKTDENKRINSNRTEMILDISHDLKNPLTTIQGYAEIIGEKEEMNYERLKFYVSAIYQNSCRANEILTSLFSYAQIESDAFNLKKESTDICEVLRLQILESLDEIELAGMSLNCIIPEDEYIVDMDKEQMRRVVFNLLGNAVKYNKPGTNIHVALDREEGKILIYVSDNGCGMEKEAVEYIFDPFVRVDKARNSKTGGSGLGLSIVKKIVEAHGGIVMLETDINAGCRFTITLSEKI